MRIRKNIFITILVVLFFGIGFLYRAYYHQDPALLVYTSDAYGISFKYPGNYIVYEPEYDSGERLRHTIVLTEDTPEHRALLNGEVLNTEGPPTITINIYQNILDAYTTESFIRNTSFSNFKLSDGVLATTTIGGVEAFRYHATGLYENENVVIARPAYVYMFTAFYDSPTDKILADFEGILKTIQLNVQEVPTSADNAPPGSIHNLPVPKAVSAVRTYTAKKLGVSEGMVIILSAYEKNWSDSCLGLAGSDEICAQMVVLGYEITTQVAGVKLTFHTNSDGTIIRQVLQ